MNRSGFSIKRTMIFFLIIIWSLRDNDVNSFTLYKGFTLIVENVMNQWSVFIAYGAEQLRSWWYERKMWEICS
jgi:hypothetical protein